MIDPTSRSESMIHAVPSRRAVPAVNATAVDVKTLPLMTWCDMALDAAEKRTMAIMEKIRHHTVTLRLHAQNTVSYSIPDEH